MQEGRATTRRTQRNSYTTAFEFEEPGAGSVPTPGPNRAAGDDQKLVMNLIHSLHRHPEDVNATKIAADLLTQEARVQQNMAEIAFALLGYWAEMADCTSAQHPLRTVYDTSKKMVNSLFD